MLNALYGRVHAIQSPSLSHDDVSIPLPYRILLGFAGIGLSTISAIFTVNLLSEMSNSVTEKTLMSGVGVCFEVAKFVMIPIGFSMVAKGKIKGMLPVVVGLSLLAISIGASVGFLGANADQSSAVARNEKTEIEQINSTNQALRESINSLNDSIQSVRKNQDEFRSRGRISKASALDANITEFELKKSALIAKLTEKKNTVQSIPGFSASDSLFNSIASIFGTTSAKARNASHSIVAILLELVAITCLSMAGLKVKMIHAPFPKLKKHNEEEKARRYHDQKTSKKPLLRLVKPSAYMHVPYMHVTQKKEHVSTDIEQRLEQVEHAQIGDEVFCPWCSVKFKKRNKQHRFCCPKHRDAYHNELHPERKEAMNARGRGLKEILA
jgi:hypothetical protein